MLQGGGGGGQFVDELVLFLIMYIGLKKLKIKNYFFYISKLVLISTSKLIWKKSRNLYIISAVVGGQHLRMTTFNLPPKYYFWFILLVDYTL